MKTGLALMLAAVLTISLTGHADAVTLTGCLSGPNAKGVYELIRKDRGQKIHVGGSPDLANHVGHTVRLTGELTKNPAEIGEKEGGSQEKNVRHFKVASVEHIAKGCTE